MRESRFIQESSGRWKELEAILESRVGADPDRLAELYVRVTDDLAYARTFYPSSKTTAYLNALAGRLHQRLYGHRREARSRFVTFWTEEIPLLLFEARATIAISAAVFFGAMAAGVLSAAGDEAYVRLILGDAYVNMTLANIEGGDPMAVYKQAREVDMFLGITFNNVLVSFRLFALGLLAGAGTMVGLIFNGVMLGAFGHMFAVEGALPIAMRTVWIHGTLEIAAAVVAGAAGLELARGMLLPGTYPRGVAFGRAARRGAKIVIGLVPIFVLAGLLEGFVTRHTGMPLALALGIIIGSLAFVVWYFILYPARVALAASTPSQSIIDAP